MNITLEIFQKRAFVRIYDEHEELVFTVQGDKYSIYLTPVCFKAIGITPEKSRDWLQCFTYANAIVQNEASDNKEVENVRKKFWNWKIKAEKS
jgi:hypothetical protein